MGCGGAKATPAQPESQSKAQCMLLGAESPKTCPQASEGTVRYLQSFHGMYLCGDASGAAKADRQEADEGTLITFEDRGDSKVALRSCHGKYMCADQSGSITWDREHIRSWELFQIGDMGDGKLTLRSHHGLFLCVEKDTFTLVANRPEAKEWETFTCTIVKACVNSQNETPAVAEGDASPPAEQSKQDEKQCLGLDELAAACSAAETEDLATTLGALPASSTQRLLAALDAAEPKANPQSDSKPLGDSNDSTVCVVDEPFDATEPAEKNGCGFLRCGA